MRVCLLPYVRQNKSNPKPNLSKAHADRKPGSAGFRRSHARKLCRPCSLRKRHSLSPSLSARNATYSLTRRQFPLYTYLWFSCLFKEGSSFSSRRARTLLSKTATLSVPETQYSLAQAGSALYQRGSALSFREAVLSLFHKGSTLFHKGRLPSTKPMLSLSRRHNASCLQKGLALPRGSVQRPVLLP